MAGSEKYLVWIFPAVMRKLGERYSDVPLKELLNVVRDSLARRAPEGRKAPFPYAGGVFFLTVEEQTSEGAFRITPVYEITKMDHAVEVLDIGIVRMEEGE